MIKLNRTFEVFANEICGYHSAAGHKCCAMACSDVDYKNYDTSRIYPCTEDNCPLLEKETNE